MKRILVWMAAILAAGILVASLVPGPYSSVLRTEASGFDSLHTTQLDPGTVSRMRPACGSCHSNQTEWPWYSHVAPMSWLLRRDVGEGRQFLNFSLWQEYGTQGQGRLLELAVAQLQSGSMPPFRYSVLHTEARLNEQQRSDLIAALKQESARLLKTEQSNH